jgi:Fe-S-cluster-containing hydrogenase component 2
MPDDTLIIEEVRCMGCGQCVLACTVDALSLQRRPPDEIPLLPDDLSDWMAKRSETRGLPYPAGA